MRADMKSRVARLEAHLPPCLRSYHLNVVYVGGEAPPQDESWSLTILLHEPWCEEAGHTGVCVRPATPPSTEAPCVHA